MVAKHSNGDIVIIGAGIGGLVLALALHREGLKPLIFETFVEPRPLGAGINVLPHAMRELASLGLEEALCAVGVETKEICFFTTRGQKIFSEPRGKDAGYKWPQISIHRADLHGLLLQAVRERLGPDAVTTAHRCTGIEQAGADITVFFVNTLSENKEVIVKGRVAIACDGVHSVVRRQLHPKEATPRFEGTILYRGTSPYRPFLSGASMVYLGTIDSGLFVAYPIRNSIDDSGSQLINWVVEVKSSEKFERDWNRPSDSSKFMAKFEHCRFPWLDIPTLIESADAILEYPMFDQQPLNFWTSGRATLLGDAAHPMMPRGSNGAAQAIIDACVLGRLLGGTDDWLAALKEYEDTRLPATTKVVLANRTIEPSAVIRLVEERTAGRQFERLEDIVSEEELVQWQERYRQVVGFRLKDLS